VQLTSKILAFAGFGIFVEVIFRAFTNTLEQFYFNQPVDLTLRTNIYFWMIPIYGFSYVLLNAVYQKLVAFPILFQLLILTVSIFVIEYSTGFALQQIIGKCPWEYKIGYHLHGLIRLDYIPVWMLFSYLLLLFYKWINAVRFAGVKSV